MHRRDFATVALATSDAAVLGWARPRFAELARHLAAPRPWLHEVGTDTAIGSLAAAALWVVAAWLGIGLLAVAAGRLPGAGGRAGAWVCRRLLPGTLIRLVAGSAGLGVLLAPVAAAATPRPVPHPAASRATLPAPAWPLDPKPARATPPPPREPAPGVTPHPISLPPPSWPSSGSPAPAPRPHPPAAQQRAGRDVRVRAGDSLWLITARRLGPAATTEEIAAQWPRWYAANRDVIGRDPSLIRPGQLLHTPPKEGRS